MGLEWCWLKKVPQTEVHGTSFHCSLHIKGYIYVRGVNSLLGVHMLILKQMGLDPGLGEFPYGVGILTYSTFLLNVCGHDVCM